MAAIPISVLKKEMTELASRVECMVAIGLDGEDQEILAGLIFEIDELFAKIMEAPDEMEIVYSDSEEMEIEPPESEMVAWVGKWF